MINREASCEVLRREVAPDSLRGPLANLKVSGLFLLSDPVRPSRVAADNVGHKQQWMVLRRVPFCLVPLVLPDLGRLLVSNTIAQERYDGFAVGQANLVMKPLPVFVFEAHADVILVGDDLESLYIWFRVERPPGRLWARIYGEGRPGK